MDQMVTLISNTCFPIAVAAYLLIRFESKIDNLSKNINDLSMVIKESNNKSQSCMGIEEALLFSASSFFILFTRSSSLDPLHLCYI